MVDTKEPICPLCKRPLGTYYNKHHLIPKTFKGKETVDIHRICHDKIHSVFTERELKQQYNTIEKLLEHEEIQKFVRWLANKDPDFYERHRDMDARRRKRKKNKKS
jgi:hypothetical protein